MSQVSKVIADSAPEGATHYSAGGRVDGIRRFPSYWRPCTGGYECWVISSDRLECWSKGKWPVLPSYVVPLAPSWDGEGMPPEGLLVEAFFPMDTTPAWLPTKLLYVSDQSVIYSSGSDDDQEIRTSRESFNGLNVKFRPIRTAEQIAVEEREKAIDQMIADTNVLTGIMSDRRIMAGQLYDANWRKKVEP